MLPPPDAKLTLGTRLSPSVVTMYRISRVWPNCKTQFLSFLIFLVARCFPCGEISSDGGKTGQCVGHPVKQCLVAGIAVRRRLVSSAANLFSKTSQNLSARGGSHLSAFPPRNQSKGLVDGLGPSTRPDNQPDSPRD